MTIRISPPHDLQLARRLITLRLTRAVRFHFNHGGILPGLLKAALGNVNDLPDGIIPFACESGTVRFESGDAYRIGLTLVGDAVGRVSTLERGLKIVGRHRGSGHEAAPSTLAGNFDVVAVDDLPAPDLAGLTAAMSHRERITVRFISPLRLERPRALQEPGRRYVTEDCFPASHVLERAFKRVYRLAYGRFPDQQETAALCPPSPTALTTTAARGLWLDLPIRGAGGRPSERSRAPEGDESRRASSHPRGYTLGGFLGTATFASVPDSWIPWLVIARFVHLGEAVSHGLGRFVFTLDDVRDDEPFRPARTMLARVAELDSLDHAFTHLLAKSSAPGMDGRTPAQVDLNRRSNLSALAADLLSGAYRAQPLRGFVRPRPDGKLRPLAIATVGDRVVQRAACDVMSPSIEALLEDCSYAYRKGFSRRTAARAVERAWDDGYRYVLDADISAFFDSVEWGRLFAKLHALFPFDPLVEIIKTWVRAPIVFDGRRLERTRGLPQGIAVAPLLANLFLDEFDEELLGEEFRLVRYADDFVVLCKDVESAQHAQAKAQEALGRLGLDLHPSKTSIRPLDAGFSYLGYLFCRSMVIEETPPVDGSIGTFGPDTVPSSSWLAQVPFERVRALATTATRMSDSASPVEAVRLSDPGAGRAETSRPLYVASTTSRLSLRGEAVVLERAAAAPIVCPIRSLSHVVLAGSTRATLPTLMRLAGFGVPVYLCRRTGELITALLPHAPAWDIWMAQGRAADDPRLRLAFARAIVSAKLHNQALLPTRVRWPTAAETSAALRRLAHDAADADDLASLTGLEGRGAAIYFGAVSTWLAPSWGFEGRRKHPPPDPVNSLLSFGYTMMYHHVSTSLVAAGLNPRIGLFHRAHGAHHALASDLIEEFRYLIDALVWRMVARGQVKPTDFQASPDGQYPCLMTPEFRRAFVEAVERRLLTEVSRPGIPAVSYRGWFDRQAACVRSLVLGREDRYKAFRVGTARTSAGEDE